MCKSIVLNFSAAVLAAGLLAGCSSDSPHDYGQQRPPVDQLTPGDAGLQSKDVLQASDGMAMDLLSDPQLNSSRTQWTMVVSTMQDMTVDREFGTNFNIFLERLRTDLSQQGRGRVRLIENKATFEGLQNQELQGGSDTYGQTGGPTGQPAAINPDYALYGKALDMPNRATNFYLLEFNVVDLRTREQVWSRDYNVKVSRDDD